MNSEKTVSAYLKEFKEKGTTVVIHNGKIIENNKKGDRNYEEYRNSKEVR